MTHFFLLWTFPTTNFCLPLDANLDDLLVGWSPEGPASRRSLAEGGDIAAEPWLDVPWPLLSSVVEVAPGAKGPIAIGSGSAGLKGRFNSPEGGALRMPAWMDDCPESSGMFSSPEAGADSEESVWLSS